MTRNKKLIINLVVIGVILLSVVILLMRNTDNSEKEECISLDFLTNLHYESCYSPNQSIISLIIKRGQDLGNNITQSEIILENMTLPINLPSFGQAKKYIINYPQKPEEMNIFINITTKDNLKICSNLKRIGVSYCSSSNNPDNQVSGEIIPS